MQPSLDHSSCQLPASLEQAHLLPSQILRPHARWYVREMRIRAYAQLLESYSSLTLKSMSAVFGMKEAFVSPDSPPVREGVPMGYRQ
ncbi:hypothetical protein JB92DRAFT_1391941 [Gautieria morchelliformis]|nr:hypothetical protein JB92DRAFT_1391941 [Gautieria morchelliformis]